MPSLVVIFGRDRGRHFSLPRGKSFVMGRDYGLSHRLNDRSISREHLEFIHDGPNGNVMVHDLQSRNGARINGERLYHSKQLQDGDILQVGYTLMVFVRVTFEAYNSVLEFMEVCEQAYEPYLRKMRDRASMHVEPVDGSGGSSGSLSGVFQLGSMFKR